MTLASQREKSRVRDLVLSMEAGSLPGIIHPDKSLPDHLPKRLAAKRHQKQNFQRERDQRQSGHLATDPPEALPGTTFVPLPHHQPNHPSSGMKLIPSFSRPFLVAGPREAGADAKRFEASEIPSISLSNHGREVTLNFRQGFQSLLWDRPLSRAS